MLEEDADALSTAAYECDLASSFVSSTPSCLRVQNASETSFSLRSRGMERSPSERAAFSSRCVVGFKERLLYEDLDKVAAADCDDVDIEDEVGKDEETVHEPCSPRRQHCRHGMTRSHLTFLCLQLKQDLATRRRLRFTFASSSPVVVAASVSVDDEVATVADLFRFDAPAAGVGAGGTWVIADMFTGSGVRDGEKEEVHRDWTTLSI